MLENTLRIWEIFWEHIGNMIGHTLRITRKIFKTFNTPHLTQKGKINWAPWVHASLAHLVDCQEEFLHLHVFFTIFGLGSWQGENCGGGNFVCLFVLCTSNNFTFLSVWGPLKKPIGKLLLLHHTKKTSQLFFLL
jgi:hypothetical protein